MGYDDNVKRLSTKVDNKNVDVVLKVVVAGRDSMDREPAMLYRTKSGAIGFMGSNYLDFLLKREQWLSVLGYAVENPIRHPWSPFDNSIRKPVSVYEEPTTPPNYVSNNHGGYIYQMARLDTFSGLFGRRLRIQPVGAGIWRWTTSFSRFNEALSQLEQPNVKVDVP